MAYIGNEAQTAFTSFERQSLTGDGTTGPYTLSHSVANEQEIEVFVNFVRQRPGDAYTASGNQLTMTGNVLSTDDFYVVFQGKAVQTVVPPAGSVTDSMITGLSSSKLTGALPAIDGSALTGVSAGSNIIEVISGVCDGSTHTVNGTAYTFPNITAGQSTSTTYADVTGSSFTYTPPSDATRVEYHFQCLTAPINNNRKFNHYKFYIDSDEVLYARTGFGDYTNSYEEIFDFRWVIGIGGTADTNVGRLATWTADKTMKMTVRTYSSGNEAYLHRTQYWDGGYSNNLRLPTLTITAYK